MAIIMQYFLPVVPDSAPIVINVNQYDYDDPSYAGRLVFNLIYEGTAYDMTGATAMIQGTKPDGKEFAYVASVSGSVVRAKLTQQMTAVYGRTVGNIIVNDTDGNRVGTFAFWMDVQKSPFNGSSDPSETEIPALVALATEQAISAQQSATTAAAAADEAEAYTGHPAYIGLNGDWYVFNTMTGLFEDSGVDARGRSGNRWYVGTAVSGKSTTPTAYATGIDLAYAGDMYLNKSEGAIYECTLGGDAATALWKYDMTLTGGGGGSEVEWTQIQTSTGATKIATITIDGVPTDVYAPQGGGGGGGDSVSWSQVQTSTGGKKIATITINNTPTDVYAPEYAMTPTPDASLTDAQIVSAINAQTPTSASVVSAYSVQRWSNEKRIRRVITGASGVGSASIGSTGIGTWYDGDLSQIDPSTDEADWWYDAAFQIPDGWDIDFGLKFDLTGPEPITLGGYILDTTTGKLCVKFGNTLATPASAAVAADITVTRNDVTQMPTP